MDKEKLYFGLREKREEKGITQAELANISGVSLVSIGRYESLQRIPNVITAYRLAQALGCTLDDFVKPES